MNQIIESMGAWGVPTVVISIVVGLFIFMQITGEIIEWCGKTAPTWLKLRKLITRKRDERLEKERARDEALINATNVIKEFNSHYNPQALAQRDAWMQWVNGRAAVYDHAVSDLLELKTDIKDQHAEARFNGEILSQMYKDFNRNRILDFAHDLINARKADKPVIYSREEFKKIRDIYAKYEDFLRHYGGTNGEVNDAMEIVRQAEQGLLPNIEFLEDIRD